MKKMSITFRITLWYALLMLLIVLSVLGFMAVISDSIIQSNAEGRLITIVDYNAEEVEYDDGVLEIDNDFESFKNGVSSLVYTEGFVRIDGKLPDSFPEKTEFIDFKTRVISADGARYLVYDRLLTFKKHPSVWVRGVLPLDIVSGVSDSLFQIALFTLPLLVVLAAVGGYFITKGAFHPVRVMNQAMESITEGRDLSRRVPVMEGRDEIHALAAHLNGMLERLESSFEAEKQFVSDVSHELRTPVSVILAQCEYSLEREMPDEEARDSFQVLQKQAKRMHQLIEHLLTIARLEQGQLQIALQNTDLCALVLSLVEESAEFAPGHIEVRHEIQPGVCAPVDAPLFSRIFHNLFQNALKYGKSDIMVSLWAEDGKGFLRVADDGIGIAPEDQEKIWRRFYQVNPARTSDESHCMGLGLSIARQIALLHHGEITLQSKPGEGSAFTFMFPSS